MAQATIKISQITQDFNIKSKDVLDTFANDLGIEKKSGATVDVGEFELFMQKGILDKETAMSFRTNILERGGSEEPMELYRRFRGANPDTGALLRGRGL